MLRDDLYIDDRKTFFWSTGADARSAFRKQNKKTQASSRDLGGHVQYTRQNTNATIVQKIENFQDRWVWFARSQATRSQKLRAVSSAAWPNVSHAVSSVHLGEHHYTHLRTAVARCTNDSKPGTSPSLVLSLFENLTCDPEYWALLQTVKDFRNQTNWEYAAIILESLTQDLRKRPKTGPCSVALQRLNSIGWSWEDGSFLDQWGLPINLWKCCIQELTIMLGSCTLQHSIQVGRPSRVWSAPIQQSPRELCHLKALIDPSLGATCQVLSSQLITCHIVILRWSTRANFVGSKTHRNTGCGTVPLWPQLAPLAHQRFARRCLQCQMQ